MSDARFEDGAERPLRLIARDADDLQVIAALVQDAVLTGADLRWQPGRRRFALLVNRFRWEDRAQAEAAGRPAERVRSLLVFSDVRHAAHQGLGRRDGDTVLSLLSLDWQPDTTPDTPPDSTPDTTPDTTPAEPGADVDGATDKPAGPGRLVLVFAGDGAVALTVECLEVALTDVTRPYVAPSRRAPDHGIDI